MINKLFNKSDNISKILKVLSNPDRLSILCYLDKDKKKVSSIIKATWLSQSLVSQYLQQIKLQWIVKSKKEWRSVEYHISDKSVLKLLKEINKIFLK